MANDRGAGRPIKYTARHLTFAFTAVKASGASYEKSGGGRDTLSAGARCLANRHKKGKSKRNPAEYLADGLGLPKDEATLRRLAHDGQQKLKADPEYLEFLEASRLLKDSKYPPLLLNTRLGMALYIAGSLIGMSRKEMREKYNIEMPI